MAGKKRWRLSAIAIALVVVTGAASAELRTWTDATGKFTVTAELLKVQRGKAVLRRENGKRVSVPLDRLSDADRAFIEQRRARDPALDIEAAGEAVEEVAKRFFRDLRSRQRDVARQSLTQQAQAANKGAQSPLADLPTPDSSNRSVRTGRVEFDGNVAEITVVVRSAGQTHKTTLHLRYEDDQWRVFALSASYPDGVKSINFEVAVAPRQAADPLQALVGKPLELEGYTVDGGRLDMSRYEGKVVLVDFWATWCGPCRAEMPNIRQNWQKHHGDGFEVVAISVDRDMNALRSYVAQEKPPWTVVADNHPSNRKRMASKYGISGIPAFILLGRDGKVAAVNCRGRRLGQQLAQLIGDSGPRVSSTGTSNLR